MDPNRVGIEYEIANGSTIENLGERHCVTEFLSEEADSAMTMRFQVVDVSKALLSVHHKVTEQGHNVLFSEERQRDSPQGQRRRDIRT